MARLTRHSIIVAVVAFSLVLATNRLAAGQDFADGLAAYDAGDYASSLAVWLPLAEAGNSEAQLAVAGLYLNGLGVARRPEEAARWYGHAAAAGDPVARLNLGDLYARGLGVPRDLVRAFAWLSLAAEQGRVWAARRRDEIGGRLTPRQLAAARALIARHQPRE